ncbi:O-antigen ligase family protein [Gammaproteobacteria bacterium]|nr:O-antigen ligase family protein [Gammaproteobacteria bacterium]
MSELTILPSSILGRSIILLLCSFALVFLLSMSGISGSIQILSILVFFIFGLSPLVQLSLTNIYSSFFWLLILNSVTSIYCLALYMISADNFLLIILPMLSSSIIFLIHFKDLLVLKSLVALLLFILVIPSIIGSISSDIVSVERNLVYIFYSFFLPLLAYIGMKEVSQISQSENIICTSFMIMILLSLILVPIELMSRGVAGSSISSIEIGGRAYSLLAILLLILPIFINWLPKQARPLRWIITILIILAMVISFSRGVILFCILGSIPIVFAKSLKRPKTMIYALATFFFLALILFLFKDNEIIAEIIRFWSVRLNIYDNISGLYSFDLSLIFSSSGRFEIWQNAGYWFSENIIFGYGIGSTPELLLESSGNRFGFGSMHNQSLTILVERGIIGFLALTCFWFLYVYRILSLKLNKDRLLFLYSFFLYFLYAHITGIELLVISVKELNSNTLIYFLMMLAVLEKKIEAKE